MLSSVRHSLAVADRTATDGETLTLWIDGVGCFWLCLSDRVSIGGPEPIGPVDIALLSDLKRQHAAIVRKGEGYLLEARGTARVAGRVVVDRAGLCDGAIIELGQTVRLRFRQPSALSLSARVEFLSDHRPMHAVDGIVLLADTCLLGPGDENHIVCPDWPGTMLLVRQGGELWCRSRTDVSVNGQPLGSGRRLASGDVVSGEEIRFRIEGKAL